MFFFVLNILANLFHLYFNFRGCNASLCDVHIYHVLQSKVLEWNLLVSLHNLSKVSSWQMRVFAILSLLTHPDLTSVSSPAELAHLRHPAPRVLRDKEAVRREHEE